MTKTLAVAYAEILRRLVIGNPPGYPHARTRGLIRRELKRPEWAGHIAAARAECERARVRLWTARAAELSSGGEQ
jgi:predicted DNA-binding transcriptional regulator